MIYSLLLAINFILSKIFFRLHITYTKERVLQHTAMNERLLVNFIVVNIKVYVHENCLYDYIILITY